MRTFAEVDKRNRGRRSIVPSILLVLGTLLALSCGTAQQVLQDITAQHPSARVTNVRMADIGLASLRLVFDVTVENPYAFDLPLLDVDYTLVADGRVFMSGTSAVDGKVSARHALTVELPVRVDLVSLVDTIASTRPGYVVPYTAEIALRADVAGSQPLRFPLRKSGELPVPKAPAVRVASLRWSETSLNKVEGELMLDVENTNNFPFSVSRLRWDLSLIDTPVASGGARHALALEPAQAGTLAVGISFSPLKLGTGLVHVLTDLNRESIDYAFSGIMSVETPFGPMELPYANSGTTRSEPSP